MKKILLLSALFLLSGLVQAQNLTTVSGSNITDLNGSKLANGNICFQVTDQSGTPISVSIGGGGQTLKRQYCSSVTAGVITSFTVPNPANTQPSGIYYTVTVHDGGAEVLRYSLVSFTGATFNFDNYAPLNLGSAAPLSGNSVTGNLSVTGNVAATGTVTGSNIAGGSIATGAGTTNKIPKYTNGPSAVIGDSGLSDNGSTVSTSETITLLTGGLLGAIVANDTVGGLNITTSGGKTWEFANGGALSSPVGAPIQFNGATSGLINVAAPAVAGANNLTLPVATDTLVGRATTDTLTNKTLTSPTVNSPAIDTATLTTKFSVTETTAPSGAAGKEVCYADSTNHALECSYNAGTIGRVVLDNASNTLTNKTITSPAITNPSTTGTDSGTETLSGKTLSSPFQGLTVTDTITSPIVFSVHSLLNTATNSANFATANAVAGTYEVGGYVYVSTAGTSGTLGLSFAYNNGASQAINSAANANLGTLGSNATIPTQVIQIAANTTFGWGASVTSGVGAFKYDVHLIVRKIN